MLAREYTAGQYSNYSPAESGAFLAGLELVDRRASPTPGT